MTGELCALGTSLQGNRAYTTRPFNSQLYDDTFRELFKEFCVRWLECGQVDLKWLLHVKPHIGLEIKKASCLSTDKSYCMQIPSTQ